MKKIAISWEGSRVTQAVLVAPAKTEIRSVPVDLDPKKFDALPPGKYRHSDLPWVKKNFLFVHDEITGQILAMAPDTLLVDFSFDLYDDLLRNARLYQCDGKTLTRLPENEEIFLKLLADNALPPGPPNRPQAIK